MQLIQQNFNSELCPYIDMTMDSVNVDKALAHKEVGNAAFKAGKWDEAADAYTAAIRAASGSDRKEMPTFHNNRAAAYLKLEKYELCVSDCTTVLATLPRDPKALYRRSQAHEALGRFEEAYKDAVDQWKGDRENKSLQTTLSRLHQIVQARLEENAQTANKIKQMCDLLFELANTVDKRKSAANNLLVLARDDATADLMLKENIVPRLQAMLKVEKCQEIWINSVRTVDELCSRSVERTKAVLQTMGIPWFLDILDTDDAERVVVAQHCMQTILNTFSGMRNKLDSKPDKELCEANKQEIDTLLTCLTCSITNPVISGLARDAIVEMLTRNVHHTALNWAERLVEIRGLPRLMAVCSELEEYHYESAMNITASSRTIAAVCLARIYENMYYDQLRHAYTDQIDEFIKEKLLSPDFEAKVRVTVAITSLLMGATDVGNAIISREGILSMILVMATTDDVLQQKVACECIVAATSKVDKAKSIITQGVDILKGLYKSKDDGVRVRALVGLCKLGSYGGLDASIRPFADGSTMKLAGACRQFLVKPGKDRDIRKWATNGLAYLTLDAEVKEKLIDDRPALRALIQLAKTGDQSVLYGAVTTFVNLCSAYDKQELVPEMVELAKFAKHHIPEEHELDDIDFVNKRLTVLVEEGITSALVALTKTESDNSKELLARVMNALCGLPELRGRVVQDGGAKAMLPLCFAGTEKGKRQAAQALSRIGITINPEVAFPGQRNLEVVRPLLNQLHADFTALENFEAMMALCNLAAMGETVRQRILKEGGLQRVEVFLMEDHELLCRAAVQVLCNMCVSEDVVKAHEKENDRVKFLALLCQEEDEETATAAAGALAILTSASAVCCEKILDAQHWLDVLHTLVANPSAAVQHRGMIVILNMMNANTELAQKLVDTDLMELLMGLTLLPDASRAKAREVAQQCLEAAEKQKLISKTDVDPGQIMMPDPFAAQLAGNGHLGGEEDAGQ